MKYKNRKIKNKKGFTLVELIVVLVILAVLAALLVPALTGYIDRAKEKSVVAETRMILQAVQTEMSELYGSSEWSGFSDTETIASENGKTSLNADASTGSVERYKEIVELAEVPGLSNGTGKFMAGVLPTGKVRMLVYNDGKGHIGFYHIDTKQYEVFKPSELEEGMIEAYYGKVVMAIVHPDPKDYDYWSYDMLKMFGFFKG